MSFSEILDAVDELDSAEKELIYEILSKRRIEERRNEILKNSQEVFASIENGTAKNGSLDDLLKDLED